MVSATARPLAVLLVAPFLAQADATVANVATPSFHAHLGASGAALELVVGGYLIAFAALLITGARLGETHGYKRMVLTGLATFTLASLACGLAPTPAVLVLARVLQGAGAAMMFPQALTAIRLSLHGRERARAIGAYAIALSTGAVVGQILGGVLVSANLAGTQWRAIFFVNVPVGLAAFIAAVRWLPAQADRCARRLDLAGVALMSAALLLVVLPLVLGRAEGWPWWCWVCLAAGLPVVAVFRRAERGVLARGGAPLVDVEVISTRPVAWALAALFAAIGSYYALLFTLAQYVQRGLGMSALVSGLTLLPWVASFGLAGRLMARAPATAARVVPAAGCVILAVAYAGISASLLLGAYDEALVIPLLAVGGFGLGVQFSALVAHVTSSVPSHAASDISGVATTTMQVGGALAVAVFGTLYLAVMGHGSAGTSRSFGVVTAMLAAVAVLAGVAAWRATHAMSRRGERQAWRESRSAASAICYLGGN